MAAARLPGAEDAVHPCGHHLEQVHLALLSPLLLPLLSLLSKLLLLQSLQHLPHDLVDVHIQRHSREFCRTRKADIRMSLGRRHGG